jgi:D-3-phosphoglycerate dehydrogenase
MKILISDKLSETAIEEIKKIEGFEVTVKTGMSPDELKEEIRNYDGIVIRSATKLRAEILQAANNLKVVVRAGIGLDNVDLKKAEELNIKVFNTPTATSITVAEYTIGLMFAAARMIPQAYFSMKEHKWEKKKFGGTELYGKTAGIIGFGRIGREVGRRELALGMNVIFYDIFDIKTDISAKQVDLETLLKEADYISMHLPLTDKTRNMIDKKEFELMKDNAVIINVARGGTINEKALLETLNNGKLKAAILDVFETEPPTNYELIDHPRVIPLPHLGASAKEGQERAGLEVVRILKEFFNK